jgi:hypothetical protein
MIFVLGSTALSIGLLTPAVHGQRMNGGSMQGMRSSGMMSGTRGMFSGGFGLNSYRALTGTGRYSSSAYGMAGAGQGGYGGGGSGYGGGGSQSQGGGGPGYGAGAGYAPNPAYAPTPPQQPAQQDPLASVRLTHGGLDWPVALGYLTRDGDAKELRERIDTQVQRLASRAARQSSPTELLRELQGDVDRLQKRLEQELYDMPTSRQQNADANRFLGKLKTALDSYAKASSLKTY